MQSIITIGNSNTELSKAGPLRLHTTSNKWLDEVGCSRKIVQQNIIIVTVIKQYIQ